ncbi:MAG TPA: prenyltransferase/squalene oxidase repeat-containing protein [Bryobacteraceae bacterium]|nr:prenyltransferase/squalene oxidase repeat-containing protein [Bryobacteraceae bacterium]
MTATATQEKLETLQNPDGGWPYNRGRSWTEPTVFALLALSCETAVSSEAANKAVRWLRTMQRADGGFAPRPGVEESTWVTALVLLLPPSLLARLNAAGALGWILSQTGRESSWLQRMRVAMLSGQVHRSGSEGWPWFPETAAWVAPTAFAILALREAQKRDPRHEIHERARSGQEFLMSRMCADGGWNHGSSKALGYDGPSYPETTGLALLALRDLKDARLDRSLERAARHLESCQSSEAASWLQLGLLAHGRGVLSSSSAKRSGVQQVALGTILEHALRGGGVFVS